MVGAGGCWRDADFRDAAPERTREDGQPDPGEESGLLHVVLQEGFAQDEVIVDVDTTTHEFADVSTRLQVGMAQTFDVQVPRGTARVVVRVPGRGAQGAIEVRVGSEHWLRIDLDADGRVTFAQPDRFRFA